MIENIKIRKAILNDLDQLLIWGRKLYEVEKQFEPLLLFSPEEARDRYTHQLSDSSCLFLVAEHDSRPVGYLYAHLDKVPYLETDKKECCLEVIYLEEESRGKMIAHTLIEGCIEWAKTNGALRIRSEIFARNRSSIRAFEKSGFELTNVVYSKTL